MAGRPRLCLLIVNVLLPLSLVTGSRFAIAAFQTNGNRLRRPTNAPSNADSGFLFVGSPPTPRTSTRLSLAVEAAPDFLLATESIKSALVTSPEPIHTAFSVATFGPQPFWLLMILFPKATFTKKTMGGLEIPLLFSLVHLSIVISSIAQEGSGVTAPLSEFNDVFDPAGDPQKAFMGMVSSYPNFVAEEWSHVLTWDLFVGRWIWLDGLRRGIFTGPSVLLCNLIGPPGLLLHWAICAIQRKPILEAEEKQALDDL